MEWLLEREELIEFGGLGVKSISGSLTTFLSRWSNYMIKIGLSKLSEVITLYEEQIERKTHTGEPIKASSIFLGSKLIEIDQAECEGQPYNLIKALRQLVQLKKFYKNVQNKDVSDSDRFATIVFAMETTYRFI